MTCIILTILIEGGNGKLGTNTLLHLSLLKTLLLYRPFTKSLWKVFVTKIAGGPRPWTSEVREKQDKLFQRTVTAIITKNTRPDPVKRIREKLERWTEGHKECSLTRGWGISNPIGSTSIRIHKNLESLKKFLPPRVCSSVLKTMFNGWNSHRRHQNRGAVTNKCRFGCGGAAEDSIEHYCRCPATITVLSDMLRVTVAPSRGLAFWCMDFSSGWEEMLICCALSIHATYTAFNIYRCKGYNTNIPTAIDAMREIIIIQAAMGDEKLSKFLRERWSARGLSYP